MHVYPKGCFFKSFNDIKDKKITIMGLGLNGGGLAAVRFFSKHGALITVTDMKTAEQLKPTLDTIENDKSIDKSRITYILGEHRIEDFENADVVIKNPGVKIEGNKYLEKARVIESDMSIFLNFTKSPIIAITGSKGKSSTVSAIHYGLNNCGYKAFLGGNITVSPLTFLEETNEETPVVLELSSWQLADLRGRGLLKPHICLMTKIVADHQNWYGNMENYIEDKKLLYADQDKGCYSIFDFDEDEPAIKPANFESWGAVFASETKGTVLRYSKTKLPKGTFGVWQEKNKNGSFEGKVLLPYMEKAEVILKGLTVPGEHMKTNVLNAALVLYLMHIPAEKIIKVLGSWSGIEHRLQYFHTYKSSKTVYKFYNDTCSTVPEATAAASQSFEKPVILICGGTDKGLVFDKLTETLINSEKLYKKPDSLWLLQGTATEKLTPILDENGIKYNGPYQNLLKLLEELKEYTYTTSSVPSENKPKEFAIVFSPGATSFGMFTNEFDRGHKFMSAVKEMFN